MPSPSSLTISVRQRLGRAEATFPYPASIHLDAGGRESVLESRGGNTERLEQRSLHLQKDQGLSQKKLTSVRISRTVPKVQLESLILAQNER